MYAHCNLIWPRLHIKKPCTILRKVNWEHFIFIFLFVCLSKVFFRYHKILWTPVFFAFFHRLQSSCTEAVQADACEFWVVRVLCSWLRFLCSWLCVLCTWHGEQIAHRTNDIENFKFETFSVNKIRLKKFNSIIFFVSVSRVLFNFQRQLMKMSLKKALSSSAVFEVSSSVFCILFFVFCVYDN